jgi:hypothetical protein
MSNDRKIRAEAMRKASETLAQLRKDLIASRAPLTGTWSADKCADALEYMSNAEILLSMAALDVEEDGR